MNPDELVVKTNYDFIRIEDMIFYLVTRVLKQIAQFD